MKKEYAIYYNEVKIDECITFDEFMKKLRERRIPFNQLDIIKFKEGLKIINQILHDKDYNFTTMYYHGILITRDLFKFNDFVEKHYETYGYNFDDLEMIRVEAGFDLITSLIRQNLYNAGIMLDSYLYLYEIDPKTGESIMSARSK